MTSEEIKEILSPILAGDIHIEQEMLEKYSHDASLFEVKPQVVIFPKNSSDVQAIMKWVGENKKEHPKLSVTARSAGTDMSGGAINDSIILDFTRYMNTVREIKDGVGVVEPGCFYRDFEKETLKQGLFMPAYTASREICAVGGMAGNNAGGENTVKYGKVEDFIAHLRVVFTDGNEYLIKPTDREGLEDKSREESLEGKIYREISELIFQNKEKIMSAKPNVSKNSAGYYLWNVWDEQGQVFDLCKLIIGSQGTLGIITEIGFKLVRKPAYGSLLAIFMPSLEKLPEVVGEVMTFKPDSFETYDDYSLKLAIKFFFDFFAQMGFVNAIRLGLQFIPELRLLLVHGIPKLTLLVQFTGENKEEVQNRLAELQKKITHFGLKSRLAKSEIEAEKYWEVRRQSFNMLRKHVHRRRTAPFIDDIIVKPEYLPEFLPKVEAVLSEYKLIYTIAGHAGDGNFHIIPLMNLESPYSSDQILEISQKIYTLVLEYKGSITAEHNDGIIRTPYLEKMYGAEIVQLFKKTKEIFDFFYILNPGKKVGGTFEDIKNKLIRKNN
ncbi:MAG: Oxidoreductase [Parcubacteria group bacterium GW2011_GWA1_38_7]|nr:MAG: Oxidoreductase [Parcubacteria group bacterium GW2011_GWA1_38_7]